MIVAMIVPWLSFIAALAGFGLISLTMQRHAGVWSERAGSWWQSRGGKRILTLAGTAALVGSGVVALRDNQQLGAIYWSAYLMAAVLLVTMLHAYAERWMVRVVALATAALIVSIIASLTYHL